MANIIHILDIGRSDVVLARIKEKRAVRCWHAASGELIGIWQTKGGRTCAIAQKGNRVITYRGMQPFDNWVNGSGDCLNPIKFAA